MQQIVQEEYNETADPNKQTSLFSSCRKDKKCMSKVFEIGHDGFLYALLLVDLQLCQV